MENDRNNGLVDVMGQGKAQTGGNSTRPNWGVSGVSLQTKYTGTRESICRRTKEIFRLTFGGGLEASEILAIVVWLLVVHRIRGFDPLAAAGGCGAGD